MPWEKTLWLVDGSSYIYRAFYALPPLVNSNGVPTGALYGLIKMLTNLIEQQQPSLLCIALDPPGKTKRHEIFEQYKANRSAMPDDLKAQMPFVEPILKAMGLYTLKLAGEEADDVIGTLCFQAQQKGIKVRISSPDKDFAQLVNEHVILENTMSSKQLDIEGVKEKFGVRPEQIIDYLALVGDSADNIPGIPKVGPKTACKWLNDYNSIEQLVANADSIKGAVGESFRANVGNLELYQDLVTIKNDLAIECKFEELGPRVPNIDKLAELYAELEFSSLLKALPKKAKVSVENSVDLISLSEIQKIGFSDELAIFNDEEFTFIADKSTNYKTKIALADVLKEVNKNPGTVLVGFNIKPWLQYGVKSTDTFDIQLAQYVLNSQSPIKSLEDISSLYNIDDNNKARIVWELKNAIEVEFSKNHRLRKLFYELELPLMQVIQQMELNGISLNVNKMAKLSEEFNVEIDKIMQKVQEFSEDNINLSSPKQVRELLFEKLNLPAVKKTSKGEASTSEEALSAIVEHHPLPEMILQHRQVSKLLSTYTNPLPKMIAADGRLHGEFSQVVTSTGRLASSNPNLQNIPVRSEQGRRIREAFIAGAGNKLLSADYSQIELRIMAHLSQDENLLLAFESGLDVHTHTAATLFNCDLVDVSTDQRRKAKAINFGLIYGMSAFGLSKQIQCDRKQAKELIEHYFDRYPGVLHYMEATRSFVKKTGYVETLMGRRLYLPEINSGKHNIAMAAERAAINAPMQGTSADMIKQAMLSIDKELVQFGAKILLQVHDELILEASEFSVLELSGMVERCMLGAINLSIPLVVNLSIGDSWGTLKPIKRSLL